MFLFRESQDNVLLVNFLHKFCGRIDYIESLDHNLVVQSFIMIILCLLKSPPSSTVLKLLIALFPPSNRLYLP